MQDQSDPKVPAHGKVDAYIGRKSGHRDALTHDISIECVIQGTSKLLTYVNKSPRNLLTTPLLGSFQSMQKLEIRRTPCSQETLSLLTG